MTLFIVCLWLLVDSPPHYFKSQRDSSPVNKSGFLKTMFIQTKGKCKWDRIMKWHSLHWFKYRVHKQTDYKLFGWMCFPTKGCQTQKEWNHTSPTLIVGKKWNSNTTFVILEKSHKQPNVSNDVIKHLILVSVIQRIFFFKFRHYVLEVTIE